MIKDTVDDLFMAGTWLSFQTPNEYAFKVKIAGPGDDQPYVVQDDKKRAPTSDARHF